MELIKAGIEEIRANGKPAGIGAHRIEAIKACVDYGIKPDFWVKTCHSYNYWSAQTNQEWNDNKFDFDPEETIRYMGTLKEPWIAFKVLAAGCDQTRGRSEICLYQRCRFCMSGNVRLPDC